MEEQRVAVLAYPTLRRKATLLGEAQGGTNCQLSATTGLPAISMPAGFSVDGVPVGLEFLGGAFTESALLNYAYAWEQQTKPRRPPFSTPPLIKGLAPPPSIADVTIGAATVRLSYERTTGALRYDVTTANMATTDRVIGLTIQRSDGDKTGPVVAHLLAPNQITGSGTLTMRGRDREDLAGGRLYLHFYTRQAPLGAAKSRISF
jgi:hypothetical protein